MGLRNPCGRVEQTTQGMISKVITGNDQLLVRFNCSNGERRWFYAAGERLKISAEIAQANA